jgi:hypothetical protein
MTQTIPLYADDTCDLYVELGTATEPVLVRWSGPRPPSGRTAREGGEFSGIASERSMAAPWQSVISFSLAFDSIAFFDYAAPRGWDGRRPAAKRRVH